MSGEGRERKGGEIEIRRVAGTEKERKGRERERKKERERGSWKRAIDRKRESAEEGAR